jgi:endogenous inhibitor of DNA gyrase (YacG/DUF329 family)
MDREAGVPRSFTRSCPICGEPTDADYRPFCSRRCADVDLSRWLKGTYAIPGGQADADEDGDNAQAAQGASDNKGGIRHEDE